MSAIQIFCEIHFWLHVLIAIILNYFSRFLRKKFVFNLDVLTLKENLMVQWGVSSLSQFLSNSCKHTQYTICEWEKMWYVRESLYLAISGSCIELFTNYLNKILLFLRQLLFITENINEMYIFIFSVHIPFILQVVLNSVVIKHNAQPLQPNSLYSFDTIA